MSDTTFDAAVHLIWLGPRDTPRWDHGSVLRSSPTPRGVRSSFEQLRASNASGWWLLWDCELGPPDPVRIAAAARERGDVKHAGLILGLKGAPRALDFVSPLWMLNLDATEPEQATSWRISFRACLMRSTVPDAAGLPEPGFSSLDACSLHYGHVALRRGVVTRSSRALLSAPATEPRISLPLADQIRFVSDAYGRRWAAWAAARFLLTRSAGPREALKALRGSRPPADRPPPPVTAEAPELTSSSRAVTVLVPTVDRYPYLHKLLGQLRSQTVVPAEIVIVDQTAPADREVTLADRYPDLPLRVFYLDEPGQCTARNLGLAQATGELVMFLDDDDEIDDLLLARHLATLGSTSADTSSGIVEEVGSTSSDPAPATRRLSDVFPTNNTLASLAKVREVDGFDPAFDKGQRADHDLGVRLYLSGAMMLLDPRITLLHHHAPRGGLRTHGARVTTRASSLSTLTHRNLPTVSDLYLGLKYYSRDQVLESVWISLLATFRSSAPAYKRVLKALIALGLMPRSIALVRRRLRTAGALLEDARRRAGPPT